MNTFKFACPSCRQHVETGDEATGRQIECPACKSKIIVPSPPVAQGLVPIAAWVNPPKPAAPPPTPATGDKSESPVSAPTQPPPAPLPKLSRQPEEQKPEFDPENPFAVPAAQQRGEEVPQADSRIAVLTPIVKLEIVRAARSLISDKSRWMPGKTGSVDYGYAGKSAGGKIVPVPFASIEATHFSIFGAVMLELHRRNVANTARGRREFLDAELAGAIHEVLSREAGGAVVDEMDRPPLTHDQCLAVLDVLEKGYSDATTKAKADRVERTLEDVRMEDLVRKLEKKSPIKPEEVATALYHELEAVKKRLAALEKNSTGTR